MRYAEDLVADDSPDQKSLKFDEFMQHRVLGYEGDPKFVMVVLISHGLSNGVFVLGEKEDKNSFTRDKREKYRKKSIVLARSST